ncbi:MAG: hypothetical protein LBM38_01820 [Clostridiales bacterium]|jgi:hypothetical protein|nr:hypothetical protein [Clostridiales bacterium]
MMNNNASNSNLQTKAKLQEIADLLEVNLKAKKNKRVFNKLRAKKLEFKGGQEKEGTVDEEDASQKSKKEKAQKLTKEQLEYIRNHADQPLDWNKLEEIKEQCQQPKLELDVQSSDGEFSSSAQELLADALEGQELGEGTLSEEALEDTLSKILQYLDAETLTQIYNNAKPKSSSKGKSDENDFYDLLDEFRSTEKLSYKDYKKNKESMNDFDSDNYDFGSAKMALKHYKLTQEQINKELSDWILKRFVSPNNNRSITSDKIDYYRKQYGDRYMHKKKIVKDFAMGLEYRIPRDTYSHPFEKQHPPIAIYFDISGSNYNSIDMYAKIVSKIMKKNVSVYIGAEPVFLSCRAKGDTLPAEDILDYCSNLAYNEPDDELAKYYEFKHYNWTHFDDLVDDDKIKTLVLFTDFDRAEHIAKASEKCNVYWFCTEIRNSRHWGGHGVRTEYLDDFKGHFIVINEANDALKYLKNGFDNKEYEEKERAKYKEHIFGQKQNEMFR